MLALVFNQVADLNGWSHAELLAVMGVYTLVGGIIGTFIQPNMERLINDVRQGTLDYVLTKPDDSQVLVSVREIRIWHLVDVVLGIVILVIAAGEVPGTLGGSGMLAFLAALALGASMVYCFWLILTTAAFWIVRMDEIVDLFQGVYQAGRWPVTIYPDWLRVGLTFLVPIAFAVTVPAEAFTGRLTARDARPRRAVRRRACSCSPAGCGARACGATRARPPDVGARPRDCVWHARDAHVTPLQDGRAS